MEVQTSQGTGFPIPSPLATEITEAVPPSDGYSLWFLGQNSFVLKAPDGMVIAVDPYLSDYCATRGKSRLPTPKSRLFPPPLLPAELDCNVVLLTHSHCDHADPETLSVLAGKSDIDLFAPRDAAKVALDAGFPSERVRIIHAGECIDLDRGGPRITASFALPTDGTDLNHVGYLLVFPNGSTFWNTGDTAWHETLPMLATAVFRESLPAGKAGPDLMAVCINSGYGNLSHWDAARLAGTAKPRYTVPVHWDLFPHNSCDPFPFRTSLEKNCPGTVYSPLEHGVRYDFSEGKLSLVRGKLRDNPAPTD